ncbi:MAG: BcsE family c-di-GMP-binding protein [Methylococcaceae bacterium]|nr:BcsE family c-di-GMP-binding protein [Methylococcaceae bacterium]
MIFSRREKLSALSIGVRDLPVAVGLLRPGNLYAVGVRNAQARRLLIANTASRALQQGAKVAIISAQPADQVEFLLALDAEVDRAVEAGSLCFFSQLEDYAVKLERHGADRFLTELEDSGLQAGTLLLLDGANRLFSGHDRVKASTQARLYCDWFRGRRMIGIFCFADFSLPESAANRLKNLGDIFSGKSELKSDQGRFIWDVTYWETENGVVRGREFGVYCDPSGKHLVANGLEIDTMAQSLIKAPDERRVILTAHALDMSVHIPEGWKVVAGYAEILAAACDTIAATIVLHFERHEEFQELAYVVHSLRMVAGRGIKLIVWEKGERLRYSQASLLTGLGVNLVLYKEQGMSKLLLAIEDLQGVCFIHCLEQDFESAVKAATPMVKGGYLPPKAFGNAVSLALNQRTSMQHVLVCLRLSPEIAHIDALLACRIERPGDFLSADETQVYLFLFGCPESDIDTILDRIMALPVEELFLEQARYTSRELIAKIVDDFVARAEHQAFTDFSLQLRKPESKAAPSTEKLALENPTEDQTRHRESANGTMAAPRCAPGGKRSIAPCCLLLRKAIFRP